MTNELNIANAVVNGSAIIALGFALLWAIRHWIKSIESTIKQNRIDGKKENETTAISLALSTEEKHKDLKERIDNNKAYYSETYHDLKDSISKVFDLQRIQNGAVAENKTGLAAQVAFCKAIQLGNKGE
jgi:hypothetical protein